jgi:hypothetical protein
MLKLVVTTAREQVVKPPHELPIAQEKNNLSTVLTEMSAGCPGGLEVSTADQYSQDPRFKTNGLHQEKKIIYSKTFFYINTSFYLFIAGRTTRSTTVCELQRTCIAWQTKARVSR